jgi:hypothetical protein
MEAPDHRHWGSVPRANWPEGEQYEHGIAKAFSSRGKTDCHQEHHAVDPKTSVRKQLWKCGSCWSISQGRAQIPSGYQSEDDERNCIADEEMEVVV